MILWTGNLWQPNLAIVTYGSKCQISRARLWPFGAPGLMILWGPLRWSHSLTHPCPSWIFFTYDIQIWTGAPWFTARAPNWSPLSQIKGFKQGPFISNKGSQTGATFFKFGFQTPGPAFLKLKFYFKLNKLFSNAKYYTYFSKKNLYLKIFINVPAFQYPFRPEEDYNSSWKLVCNLNQMFCYRDYQLTTRFNQQNEKSTLNILVYLLQCLYSFCIFIFCII